MRLLSVAPSVCARRLMLCLCVVFHVAWAHSHRVSGPFESPYPFTRVLHYVFACSCVCVCVGGWVGGQEAGRGKETEEEGDAFDGLCMQAGKRTSSYKTHMVHGCL